MIDCSKQFAKVIDGMFSADNVLGRIYYTSCRYFGWARPEKQMPMMQQKNKNSR